MWNGAGWRAEGTSELQIALIPLRANDTHFGIRSSCYQARKNLIFVTDVRLQSKVTGVTVSTILALRHNSLFFRASTGNSGAFVID
jgi:hypothetical protein